MKLRQQLPGLGIVMAVFEPRLADALGDPAMGLAVHDHRGDRAADIVDRGVADDLDRTRFGIDLDLADLRAVWETRDQGLVGHCGERPPRNSAGRSDRVAAAWRPRRG